MANEEVRGKVIKERPEDALYLKAYFSLVDLSNDYKEKGDSRQYEVNKLLHKIEAIHFGRAN